MAAPLRPALVTAYGKESWGFAPAFTATSAPTVAELNAASGLNLSCMVFGDQEGVTSETEKVTLPRILCETTQYQGNGPTTYSMADVVASFDPQSADGDEARSAWETLQEGVAGYMWRRQGIKGDVDVAAAQRVDLIPVEFGPSTPGKTSSDTNGVFTSVHPVAVTGKPIWNVEIAA